MLGTAFSESCDEEELVVFAIFLSLPLSTIQTAVLRVILAAHGAVWNAVPKGIFIAAFYGGPEGCPDTKLVLPHLPRGL